MDLIEEEADVLETVRDLASGAVLPPGLTSDGAEAAYQDAVITSAAQERQYHSLTGRGRSTQECHPLPGTRLILPR